MTSILIVGPPEGEAPLWVREAWIGLALPTHQIAPRSYLGVGVLTGPKDIWAWMKTMLTGKTFKHRGYAVPALRAVEALQKVHPDAATWWRQNTPHLMKHGQFFIFDEASSRIDAAA